MLTADALAVRQALKTSQESRDEFEAMTVKLRATGSEEKEAASREIGSLQGKLRAAMMANQMNEEELARLQALYDALLAEKQVCNPLLPAQSHQLAPSRDRSLH